ncbi:hypothetical protein [Kocuria sp. U4B]
MTARALAQVSVFAAAYLAVAAYALTTTPDFDADLVAVLVAGGAAAALTFGWAVADGRRPAPGSRPVRRWAAASVVAALLGQAPAVAAWFLLAGAMGGAVGWMDPGRMLIDGVLTVVVAAGVGTAVAAAGVSIGQARRQR